MTARTTPTETQARYWIGENTVSIKKLGTTKGIRMSVNRDMPMADPVSEVLHMANGHLQVHHRYFFSYASASGLGSIGVGVFIENSRASQYVQLVLGYFV